MKGKHKKQSHIWEVIHSENLNVSDIKSGLFETFTTGTLS